MAIVIRWLKQNMPEENSTEPVDLEKELRLALGDQIIGDQTIGDQILSDEKTSNDNDVLN